MGPCPPTVPPPAGPRRPGRCAADELLPERALAGDGHARRHLVEEVFLPLVAGRGTLVETLATYFAQGRSLEASARALFCHPNTVRYRLRQIGDLTGLTPTDARDAFTLEIALVLGRQSVRERARSRACRALRPSCSSAWPATTRASLDSYFGPPAIAPGGRRRGAAPSLRRW